MSLVESPTMTERKVAANRQNGCIFQGATTEEGKERIAAAQPLFAKFAEVFCQVIAQLDLSIRLIPVLQIDSADVELGTTQPARDVASYQ